MKKHITFAELVKTYEELAERDIFRESANGMLILVRRVYEFPELAQYVSHTAYLSLAFRIEPKTPTIYVDFLQYNQYAIYLDYCGETLETFYGNKSFVSLEEVIINIRKYLDILIMK